MAYLRGWTVAVPGIMASAQDAEVAAAGVAAFRGNP